MMTMCLRHRGLLLLALHQGKGGLLGRESMRDASAFCAIPGPDPNSGWFIAHRGPVISQEPRDSFWETFGIRGDLSARSVAVRSG
jgi:hypothetical protein